MIKPRTIFRRSPNFGHRPAGMAVDTIVLHADGSKSEAGTLGWLYDPASRVSYHYYVGRHGDITQLVPDEKRAWHAGKSVFDYRADVNDFSIGVSFANDQKGEAFTEAQLAAGASLVAWLCVEHGIPASRITTHAAIAPGRKIDPGPLFPLSAFLERIAKASK